MNDGKLDDATVTAYHDLSEQIRKSGLMIGKMYNPTVRELTESKFVIPSMILKETIIYEVSRYMLIEEIETKLSVENIDLIDSELAKLARLERRSVEIKEAGNKLYPGKYPNLPEFEKVLKAKKDALLEAYSKIKPVEEPVLEKVEVDVVIHKSNRQILLKRLLL